MEFPSNNVAMLLSVAFENQTIEVVFVDCVSIDPLAVVVSWYDHLGVKHVLPKLAKHKTNLFDVEMQIVDLGWRLGASRLQRITNGGRISEMGEIICRWTFIPVFGRATLPLIADYVAADPTIDEDGGRSCPYPYAVVTTLLEPSRPDLPSRAGENITTEILFAPRKT